MRQNNKRGKFIVLEGIDGSGKTTQLKKLNRIFKNRGLEVRNLDYPDRGGPIGKLIDLYLHKKYDFSREVQFLLYFSDFVKDQKSIDEWLKEGKTILSNRYFGSTLAYQCSDGFSLANAVKVSEIFGIAKPDLIIYLSISSETSLARKSKEKGANLDRHEENKKFLGKLAKMYELLASENTFAPWVKVNGEQSEEKVFSEIVKLLTELDCSPLITIKKE